MSSRGSELWWSIRVRCAPVLADAVGSFLHDAGAPGLETEESGEATTLTAHFERSDVVDSLNAFLDTLPEFFPGAARPTVEVSTIDASNWAENWKEHFPPLEIGARLFVHPPWVDTVPPGRIGIELDPGMAFGTGHHPSTRGCLAALDEWLGRAPARQVLDLGTGSGILAIAAVKLGAESVLAVDVDAEACAIAADNIATNKVSDRITVDHHLASERIGFDVIVANIFSGMLIGYANDIARRLAVGGIAIGSGFEDGEAANVAEAWAAAGLVERGRYEIDGWTTLVCQMPGDA